MSDKKTPTFETFEEMEEWLNAQQESQTEPSKKSTGKTTKGSSSTTKKKTTKASTSSRKKKPPKEDEGTSLTLDLSPDFRKGVWSSVHFYTREGDTIGTVRNDAKEEAKFRNENVLVYFHDHIFGEGCVSSCGRV